MTFVNCIVVRQHLHTFAQKMCTFLDDPLHKFDNNLEMLLSCHMSGILSVKLSISSSPADKQR